MIIFSSRQHSICMWSNGHTPFYSASRDMSFLVPTLRKNNRGANRAYAAIVW